MDRKVAEQSWRTMRNRSVVYGFWNDVSAWQRIYICDFGSTVLWCASGKLYYMVDSQAEFRLEEPCVIVA